jgi:hypothetical protein
MYQCNIDGENSWVKGSKGKEAKIKIRKHNFKNLKIWEKAMDFTNLIYAYCKELPNKERYNLINQLNRCSCSIPSNIAEGWGKKTNVHFAEFFVYWR